MIKLSFLPSQAKKLAVENEDHQNVLMVNVARL